MLDDLEYETKKASLSSLFVILYQPAFAAILATFSLIMFKPFPVAIEESMKPMSQETLNKAIIFSLSFIWAIH
ncbi:hypothetical protein [Thalassotalea insulae]|uniref:hypothetical protein n=1 Tax=Thalassotalea insulae TaxID=2056778 RepID=UPI0024E13F4C|nr:hypothetical protein [Thalassotalea insulae]